MSTYYYMRKDDYQPTTILKQIELASFYEVTDLFIESKDSSFELENMLNKLKEEDTIILFSLAVLELNKAKLSEILIFLESMSIRLISIQEAIDTHQSKYKNFLNNCLVCLEWQATTTKNMTSKRIKEAKMKGIELGRPTIATDVVEKINYLRVKEKKSIRYIADKCNVSIGTVHKYINV